MKILVLFLSLIFFSGCVALPRGEYYTPIYPGGFAHSSTCDSNGNKVILRLPLNKSVKLTASLSNGLELNLGFLVSKNSTVELVEDSITIYLNESEAMYFEIPEWKGKILEGGEEELVLGQEIFQMSKQYWSKVGLGNSKPKKVALHLPEIKVDGNTIKLEPVVFELKSGEWQFLPPLNC